MDFAKQTATQRSHFYYMADAMRRFEWDLHNQITESSCIPVEWHQIAKDKGRQPTERVTIRLDRDVLKFFRSMGAGYGPRINDVLRTFMHARLAGVVKGADTSAFYRRATEIYDTPRPHWGSWERVPPTKEDADADNLAQATAAGKKAAQEYD